MRKLNKRDILDDLGIFNKMRYTRRQGCHVNPASARTGSAAMITRSNARQGDTGLRLTSRTGSLSRPSKPHPHHRPLPQILAGEQITAECPRRSVTPTAKVAASTADVRWNSAQFEMQSPHGQSSRSFAASVFQACSVGRAGDIRPADCVVERRGPQIVLAAAVRTVTRFEWLRRAPVADPAGNSHRARLPRAMRHVTLLDEESPKAAADRAMNLNCVPSSLPVVESSARHDSARHFL